LYNSLIVKSLKIFKLFKRKISFLWSRYGAGTGTGTVTFSNVGTGTNNFSKVGTRTVINSYGSTTLVVGTMLHTVGFLLF
jgi:hypothetical protein